MNENIAKVLRPVRVGLQAAAEPIDWAARMLNGKRGYPPLWVRQKVGNLFDFEGSGAEYMTYLKLLCGLKTGMDVLDIGCGCGLICLPVNENGTLLEYLGSEGFYWGVDTDKRLIKWCQRNLRASNSLFTIRLTQNNGDNNCFDVILCKSLFTHLLLEEAEAYLQEIRRLLKPGGACLATFFLRRKTDKLTGRYTFKYPSVSGLVFHERASKPGLAIAYDAELFPTMRGLDGLRMEKIWYGSWRGNGEGLSFQDIVILRKE